MPRYLAGCTHRAQKIAPNSLREIPSLLCFVHHLFVIRHVRFLKIPRRPSREPRRARGIWGSWHFSLEQAKSMNTKAIAQVAHEANRALCLTQGDNSQLPWPDAPQWQTDSAINGVEHAKDPNVKPEDSHVSWLAEKRAAGWIWGPEKNPHQREHPCIMPYAELSNSQRIKDVLFLAVARALLSETEAI